METVRNRYIDVLRAFALMRVLTFHLFGWDWLPLLFPSMGVLFAFAGSLMASSLDRSRGAIGRVLLKRLRRLLLPLWAFGLVVVPIMLLVGWTATVEDSGSQPLGPWMLSWILPVTEPPGSDFGADWTLPLWYLRTYLWLMLLSPALLWLWRRWPVVMFILPLLAVLVIGGEPLPFEPLPIGGPLGDGVVWALTFAACWMLGFAHHDGRLQKVGFHWILILGVALCAAGVAWAVVYPISDVIVPPLVSDIPMAQALYCLGFSMVLLRLPLTMSFIDRAPVLRDVVDVINRRALTFYLWGAVAITVAEDLIDRYELTDVFENSSWGPLATLATTLLVLFNIILAVGWVEDIAARRPPRLLPLGADFKREPNARRAVSTNA